MDKNELQKKQINEADYIDIPVFIRAFLRLARRYLLLVCPLFVCLTAGIGLLSRALVKEQHVAEASFVVGVPLMDDFSYNYNLPEIRDDYVVQMSEAFNSVIKSEYMYYLLEEELGMDIPGVINWENAYGTNMGGIYAISDSMENAILLRDAVISCLPKALFSTFGDIELTVLGTSEQTSVLHAKLKSPLIWVVAGAIGSIIAYLGIIFLIALWRHDIETSEDMLKITNLPCLGELPRLRKTSSKKQSDHNLSRDSFDEYKRSFSEFSRQLTDAIGQQQIRTLLFTGGYEKRGQTELIDKLNHDWVSQGKKVQCITVDLSKKLKTAAQIQIELKQRIEEALKETDLIIINGPDYKQTVELLTMADCVDGIIYMIKAGYDQMENTEEAICTLGFAQAKLIGYVITE